MSDEETPLLAMQGINKAFNGVPALRQASLTVNRGEVRALIGQNGAGKSTIIKVLTGVYERDSGMVEFEGQPFVIGSPHEAQQAGIATIYQEVNLIPYRSVAENIFLGHEQRKGPFLNWRAMNDAAAHLLADRLDIDIDVRRPLLEYTIATQQMTAIARALSFDARLVIMDEPTSSLADAEVEKLFRVIRGLRDAGVSVIFVSHRLDELYAVCDRVTVMRDGETVSDSRIEDITKYEMVSMMIGKDLAEVRRSIERRHDAAAGEQLIEAKGLHRPPLLQNVDLSVRSGEIVGLAGLLGSGRSETARALFGADKSSGDVKVRGEVVQISNPKAAIRRRFAFLAEDRKLEGIIPGMSVRENLTLAALPKLTRRWVVDAKEQKAFVEKYIASLGVVCASPEQHIEELSGGNQQKVLIARWLATQPEFLILDEPTRGIDVGAKREIQMLVRDLATDGMGVLFISSETEELIETCDRVIVLRDGVSVAQLIGAEISEEAIMAAMASGSAVDRDEEPTND